MKTMDLVTFDDFASLFNGARLVLFHIFDAIPDRRLVESYRSDRDDELLILFDRSSDKGFLTSTSITVEILRLPKPHFVESSLSELTGLGAWAKGTLFAFETDPTMFEDMVARARDFAFGTPRSNQ